MLTARQSQYKFYAVANPRALRTLIESILLISPVAINYVAIRN